MNWHEVFYKSMRLYCARLCLIQHTFFKVHAVLTGTEQKVCLMKVRKLWMATKSLSFFIYLFIFSKRLFSNLFFSPTVWSVTAYVWVLSNIEALNYILSATRWKNKLIRRNRFFNGKLFNNMCPSGWPLQSRWLHSNLRSSERKKKSLHL